MSLDMRLVGRTTMALPKKGEECAEPPMLDGFEISDWWLRLGCWRNRPDLHLYIIETFADGNDGDEFIPLKRGNLGQIIDAIQQRKLQTDAYEYLFGITEPLPHQTNIDIETFTKARHWLECCPPEENRTVYYQAIW